MSGISYPAESYHRLYDPAYGSLWNPTEGLSPAEDGSHHQDDPRFFEWWYFDAAFSHGYHLVVIFHLAPFNLTDRKPTLVVSVTSPDGKKSDFVERYSPSECHAADDHCELHIGNNHVVAEQGQYRLSLRMRRFEAELTYLAQAPGWKAGNGTLFADEQSGHYFRWVVPLPLARVHGEIKLEGQTLDVEGLGYHDHNWGNLNLEAAFSHWYWGRLIVEDGQSGIIFGDVVARGGEAPHIQPFLLIQPSGLTSTPPELVFQYEDTAIEPITGQAYPAKLSVRASFQAGTSLLQLHSPRVIEALHFATPHFQNQWLRQLAEIAYYLAQPRRWANWVCPLIGQTTYLRFHTQGELHLPGLGVQRGQGIYEIMHFPNW